METPTAADSKSALRADALVDIASEYLSNPAQTCRAAERYQVVIHVGEDEHGMIEGGPPLAEQTVERLCCDTAMVQMQSAGHDHALDNLLDLGRKQRTVSSALRRALLHRDKGCRFPGCTDKRFVDAHHIQHWSKGGLTNQDNLVLLCRHHHRLLHEGGYSVARKDAGVFEFFAPSGAMIPRANLAKAPCFDLNKVISATGKNVSAYMDSSSAAISGL